MRGSERERDENIARSEAIESTRAHLAPNRLDTFALLGVDLVMGRREGYRFWDMNGRELMDLHLNGGTFNLGHRNPQVIAALTDALGHLDIGNHHFASAARAQLARQLVATTPQQALPFVVYVPSGSEAVDVTIRAARRATGRRRIVAFERGFHGRSGLSASAGEPTNATAFLSDRPDEFATVPFDDLEAMEAELAAGGVAAVLAEVLPATCGFPVPSPDFYLNLRALCDRYRVALIADEVQTGLGRSGHIWAVEHFGVVPDAIITGKGLSGGIYPVAAALLGERLGAWLREDGWGYVSTFGGSELGCAVGAVALELSTAPETLAGVQLLAERYRQSFEALRAQHDNLVEVRQVGLIIGLRFAERGGALRMCKTLYDEGLWAMFAGFDTSVLQFKPGLLIDEQYVDATVAAVGRALRRIEQGIDVPAPGVAT